ncbi:MAG: PIN domain-containing protein [Acidobacteriaceae bacterium]
MLRVTADSNIYISAFLSRRGNPYEFLQLARRGKVRIAVSDPILAEVADVLERKFGWPSADIAEARRRIEGFAHKVTPSLTLDGSDYIVTGDKHLLRLKQYAGIRILSISDFMGLGQEREV